jgi:hypothetical protein
MSRSTDSAVKTADIWQEQIKARGRICLPIPVIEAREGDVAHFWHQGWRTMFVTDKRGGLNAAIRVVDWYGSARWISLRQVKAAWRKRTEMND